jgi:hypothetical protein
VLFDYAEHHTSDYVRPRFAGFGGYLVCFGPLLLGTLSDTRPDLGIIRTPER